MQILWVGILLAFSLFQVVAGAPIAQADSSEKIVISQVQVGNVSSSRLVELYNNGMEPVDVTDWCVRYVTASGVATNRVCFTAAAPTQRLILPPASYILIGSVQLNSEADYVMIEGLGNGSAGSVYVVDQLGQSIDIFGWGQTIYAEGAPKSADSSTKVYERRVNALGGYVDENNNNSDFYNSTLRGGERLPYETGAIVELTDICLNIDGTQEVVPVGLVVESDICSSPPVDVCVNIDGMQASVPPGMEVDENNICSMDACINIAGFQYSVPHGYVQSKMNDCSLAGSQVVITELLPNPEGEDSGNEYIELYNPNDDIVDLSFHTISVNGDYGKSYSFKAGASVAGNGYLVLKNTDLTPAFSLTNTQGRVGLHSFDGGHLFNVPTYNNARSGESWAEINGVWQFTPFPTPGAANKALEPGIGAAGALAADCGEGRERNPVTNRCRNIAAASVLVPCKEGQYRSEETNRCRSIASAASALKPCEDHQFRNPLTNRCKNIASSDEMADCGEGRERNPVTNRCRNVLGATTVPESAFKVEPVKDGAVAFVGWWALGGMLLLAAGYGVWEWRQEIAKGYYSFISRFSGRR